MIAQDPISKSLAFIGLGISIILALFTGIFQGVWLFPAFLCLTGIVMQRDLLNKQVPDREDSKGLLRNMLFLSIVALSSLLVVSLVEPDIFKIGNVLGSRLELTGADSVLFGVCMAIGEEEVFRGGFFNYFLQPKRGSPFVAMAASAGLFTVYHLAVYQNPQALLFVFSAGFILAFVDLQIGLIAPSMFGHIGNNIFAYGTGGLLAGVLASLTSPLMLIIVGAGFALFILIVVRRQQKGRTK